MLVRNEIYIRKMPEAEEHLKSVIAEKVYQYGYGIAQAFRRSPHQRIKRLARPLETALMYQLLEVVSSTAALDDNHVPPIEFVLVRNNKINHEYTFELRQLQASEPPFTRTILVHRRNDITQLQACTFGEIESEEEKKMLLLPFALAAEYFRTMRVLNSYNAALAARHILFEKPNFTDGLYTLSRELGELLGYNINDIAHMCPLEIQDINISLEGFLIAIHDLLQNISPSHLEDPERAQYIRILRGFNAMRDRDIQPNDGFAKLLKIFIDLRAIYTPVIIERLGRFPELPLDPERIFADLVARREDIL